jgi:4,5-dihydroxyphthalate decarboxylase
MPRLELTIGCNISDRTIPLYNGDVQPDGVDLNFVGMEPEETFWRQFRYADFEISEMSMSSYMISLDRGDPEYVAIPVFPSRFFRHSLIFVNSDAGIDEPEDLRGRKVGIPEYQMTATVWQRGILQHEYGVHPSDLEWYKGGLEDDTREERIQIEFPDELEIHRVQEGQSLSEMLKSGEIDALLTARAPSSWGGGARPTHG